MVELKFEKKKLFLRKSAMMLNYLLFTAFLVAIDQFTKYLTVQNIALYEVVEFIPNVLSFTYIQNSGAAWSILEGQILFFVVVTVIVIAVILYYLYTEGQEDKFFGTILSIILAGTIGNFIDRLLYQYVVDMFKLEFIDFPIFNVADSLLVVGVILMIVYTIYIEKKESTN